MATFTIIIPFYQRQHGILSRALASVFSQSFKDVDVIVVDDQSPCSPDADIALLSDEDRARVTVIAQPNAGPGGARNTGLDHVPEATRYVAFLDSDDVWTPDHLANAAKAMEAFGGDCYWASIEGGEEFDYHFGIAALEKEEGARRLWDKPLILDVPDLAGVMLKNWAFLHMSCMVIGRPLFEKVRFDAALRLAAEDVLFFCDCIIAAKRALLCAEDGALRGEGINIFHGVDNASPEFLKQQFITWMALDRLESRFSSRPPEVETIKAHKNTARKQAIWSQIGLLRRRKTPDFRLLARWAARDPRLLQSALQLAAAKFSR
ncbi:succinoglycan biosynthesis protein ExoW [Rhizobium mesoamericanum]|uniref:glycosyltransferase family 2 protein n=1 Tax=Rhizobium mesoamericanum TaxID=1079800 RepID=UPI0027820401|nr:glycosyltransferase family 2 protein [Rhizobium mesoamericanum]MDQ0563382.1 succinoglycan biosynthesis protein ExoW [Rhizobium mesoamericanum]